MTIAAATLPPTPPRRRGEVECSTARRPAWLNGTSAAAQEQSALLKCSALCCARSGAATGGVASGIRRRTRAAALISWPCEPVASCSRRATCPRACMAEWSSELRPGRALHCSTRWWSTCRGKCVRRKSLLSPDVRRHRGCSQGSDGWIKAAAADELVWVRNLCPKSRAGDLLDVPTSRC